MFIYDNTQTNSGSYFPNGGATNQGGNTITTLVADDVTPIGSYGGQTISNIYYSVANGNVTAVSARLRVGFWYANGAGGGPGTFIQGFTLGPFSFPLGYYYSSFSPGAAMTMPTNTFWFGMSFDDNTNSTGITAAQLNNLGMVIYGLPAIGSSVNHAFQTTSAGSFFASNPAGSIFSFSGSPPPPADFYFGLSIVGGNHQPVANPQSITVNENHTLPITLTAVDPDGNPLTYAIVNSPTNGTLSGTPPNVVYAPHTNFFGSDAFTFKANNGQTDSVPALVSITVTKNLQPVANSQSLSVLKNGVLGIVLMATDANGDSLTYSIVNSPTNGTLSGTPPIVTYVPHTGFVGTDAFTFKANDGQTNSVPALITISVVNGAGLIINPMYDPSITGYTNAAIITNTINSAILEYETRFSDPVTVSILFANMSNGLGLNFTYYGTPSYASFFNALSARSATTNDAIALAHITGGANNPVNGGTNIDVTAPHLRALGFNPTPATNYDSVISLNLSVCNFDRITIDPTKFDLKAAASHEIDEVLGTISGLGTANIRPADLFRYSSTPGVRNYTNSGDNAYFSLDGVNLLARYNQNVFGDYGDWWTAGAHTPQVQDAFGTQGSTPNPGVEYTVLDAVGWTLVGALPPLRFTSITHSNSTVTLSWTAIVGRSYQLQFATNLSAVFWANLGGTLTASNSVANYTDNIGTNKGRYYRVSLLSSSAPPPKTVAPSGGIAVPLSVATNYFRPAPADGTR